MKGEFVRQSRNIIDDPDLHDRTFVFSDRHDAGRILAALVKQAGWNGDPVVCAIPAGGVPVGKEVALTLNAPLALAIVRKIRIPGNTEAGFGAVAWDGRVVMNDRLVQGLRLTQDDIDTAISATKRSIADRIDRLTGGKPFPDVAGRTVILTDDGLASGYTMLAAISAVLALRPAGITVAVPTASASASKLVAGSANRLICANIRSSHFFAVADAYRHWYDLDENDVLQELKHVPDFMQKP